MARRPVTVVQGFRQYSFLDKEELKRLTLPRWARIKRRLEREKHDPFWETFHWFLNESEKERIKEGLREKENG